MGLWEKARNKVAQTCLSVRTGRNACPTLQHGLARELEGRAPSRPDKAAAGISPPRALPSRKPPLGFEDEDEDDPTFRPLITHYSRAPLWSAAHHYQNL